MNHWQLDRWLAYWLAGTATTVIAIPLMIWIARDGHLAVAQYQSLIGALVALAAASIAYRSMLNQRAIADRQLADARAARADQHERKRMASNAALPMALARICEYSALCIYGLKDKDFYEIDDESTKPIREILPQPPSDQTIGIIKEAIEYAPAEMAPALVGLLQELQINLSRLRVLEDAVLRRPKNIFRIRDPARNVVDSLTLYAKASVLFDYARGRKERSSVSVGYEEIFEAATRHGIFHKNNCPIFAEIFSRFPRSNEAAVDSD